VVIHNGLADIGKETDRSSFFLVFFLLELEFFNEKLELYSLTSQRVLVLLKGLSQINLSPPPTPSSTFQVTL